jgi:hypothetical protein
MLSSPFSLKENGTARTLPLHINRRNTLAYRNCPAAGRHCRNSCKSSHSCRESSGLPSVSEKDQAPLFRGAFSGRRKNGPEDESWYRSAHRCSTVEGTVEGISREGTI